MPVPEIVHRRSFVSELKFWTKTEKEQLDADKAASDLNCSCYMGGRNTLNRLSTVRNWGKKKGPERKWLQALDWRLAKTL